MALSTVLFSLVAFIHYVYAAGEPLVIKWKPTKSSGKPLIELPTVPLSFSRIDDTHLRIEGTRYWKRQDLPWSDDIGEVIIGQVWEIKPVSINELPNPYIHVDDSPPSEEDKIYKLLPPTRGTTTIYIFGQSELPPPPVKIAPQDVYWYDLVNSDGNRNYIQVGKGAGRDKELIGDFWTGVDMLTLNADTKSSYTPPEMDPQKSILKIDPVPREVGKLIFDAPVAQHYFHVTAIDIESGTKTHFLFVGAMEFSDTRAFHIESNDKPTVFLNKVNLVGIEGLGYFVRQTNTLLVPDPENPIMINSTSWRINSRDYDDRKGYYEYNLTSLPFQGVSENLFVGGYQDFPPPANHLPFKLGTFSSPVRQTWGRETRMWSQYTYIENATGRYKGIGFIRNGNGVRWVHLEKNGDIDNGRPNNDKIVLQSLSSEDKMDNYGCEDGEECEIDGVFNKYAYSLYLLPNRAQHDDLGYICIYGQEDFPGPDDF